MTSNVPEHVLAVRDGSGWVGEVRRKIVPAQTMASETTETLWRSRRCNTELEARALAEERLAQGPPW